MKGRKVEIVVLDGHTLNPGDLSWSGLESLGNCVVYPRTQVHQVIERASQADIILTNKTPLDGKNLESLPNLRAIGVLATGYNVIDIETARRRGITIMNVPAYGTRSVAQTTMALLLELSHHIGHHSSSTRSGGWSGQKDFCYWDYPLVELDGLTIGLVGSGQIANEVARMASAFGMKPVFYNPRRREGTNGEFANTLQDLFCASDVVSLHCPLTQENARFVNRDCLSLMKRSAFLVNTARGQLINEQDLADALNTGMIAGAALDVLAEEPPSPDHPLLQARNCLVTPHIAWATKSARTRLMNMATENIESFLRGVPRNVVV